MLSLNLISLHPSSQSFRRIFPATKLLPTAAPWHDPRTPHVSRLSESSVLTPRMPYLVPETAQQKGSRSAAAAAAANEEPT